MGGCEEGSRKFVSEQPKVTLDHDDMSTEFATCGRSSGCGETWEMVAFVWCLSKRARRKLDSALHPTQKHAVTPLAVDVLGLAGLLLHDLVSIDLCEGHRSIDEDTCEHVENGKL